MKIRTNLLITFALISGFLSGQTATGTQTTDKKESLFSVNFTGLIKTDFIFDSRQTVTLREGSLLFYPEPKKLDTDGNDINAKANFNILAVQTKLTLTAKGPDVLGAKTSGLIEAEFFGNVNPNINVFRLRHAYIKLNWTKTEMLLGQFWHPMYEVNCNPDVISADAGLPFKVYSRNPQLRITQQLGRMRFIFAALTQIDFTSNGPEGPNPKYLRNSILPELDFQVQYVKTNEQTGTELHLGAGIDYIMLTPLLSSEVIITPALDTVIEGKVKHYDAVKEVYKTNVHASALSYNIFGKLRTKNLTFKLGGVYSGNGYALSLLGGYAVKSVTDAEKGFVTYQDINYLGFWTDLSTNGKKWQAGIFGGYGKNIGATEEVKGPYYSRGANIDYLFRVSPRVSLTINKLRFGGEVEYTAAAYGTTGTNGKVYDASIVGNLRLLFSAMYFF
jgi:hypothetical protein